MRAANEVEWLEAGYGSQADVAENLAEMWRINAYLGGFRALTRHLYPRLAARRGPASVLDVGTGAADIPRAIANWAASRGQPVRVVALDSAARVLRAAQARLGGFHSVALVRGDAGRLPLRPGAADVVISSLFMHHFAPDALAGLLRAAMQCARASIVMSDLVRGWLPYYAFKIVQPVLARNALTRHDGALSIRRAYSLNEMRQVAAAAGLPNARVHAHWPWRMTLVADH